MAVAHVNGKAAAVAGDSGVRMTDWQCLRAAVSSTYVGVWMASTAVSMWVIGSYPIINLSGDVESPTPSPRSRRRRMTSPVGRALPMLLLRGKASRRFFNHGGKRQPSSFCSSHLEESRSKALV